MLTTEQLLIKLAQSSKTPPKILEALSHSKNYCVRFWLARNPNCSVEAMKILSQDKDSRVRVRAWLAANPNCSLEAMKILSQDKDYCVHSCVAQNPTWQKYLNQNQPDREEKVC